MSRMRWTKLLTREEWIRLSGFGGAVALLHLVGWGLFFYYSRGNLALAGLGTLAYTFGLRHAFDADHIAAIDNTMRKFLQEGMQEGKHSLGVGFFFSLGHSTIVFALATGLAVATATVNSAIPSFQDYGTYVGASVSGTFLWIIGILNFLVLLDIVRIFRDMRRGRYDREKTGGATTRPRLHEPLLRRAVRLANQVKLADVPPRHALQPRADGAFMSHAYGWAFSNPIRKVYYNITVTTLSVAVALAIGTVELLQVAATKFDLNEGFWGWLNGLDSSTIGYGVVGIFVATWVVSALIWKTGKIEERWSSYVLERND